MKTAPSHPEDTHHAPGNSLTLRIKGCPYCGQKPVLYVVETGYQLLCTHHACNAPDAIHDYYESEYEWVGKNMPLLHNSKEKTIRNLVQRWNEDIPLSSVIRPGFDFVMNLDRHPVIHPDGDMDFPASGRQEGEARASTGDDGEVYCIHHWYDVGDQRAFVKRISGNVDVQRTAAWLQYFCESAFDVEASITNHGVASLLVAFYGFAYTRKTENCECVDMYHVRESFNADVEELLNDRSLYRNNMWGVMAPYVYGC